MPIAVPTLPATQTAIITQANLKLGISHHVPVPHLDPEMVLIKNVAVPLNPTDYKMPANFPSPGTINGCDFAGIIIAVGSAVKRPLRIGHRVCGAVHGANPIRHQSGTFAEYVEADPDFIIKIPDEMTWETAAAIGGAGIGTVGLGLFYSLGLPSPEKPAEKPVVVLVYGGSTACGTMAIQLLRLYVFATIENASYFNGPNDHHRDPAPALSQSLHVLPRISHS